MKTTQNCSACIHCTKVPNGRRCNDETDNGKVTRPPFWPWILPQQRCDRFTCDRKYLRGAAPQ